MKKNKIDVVMGTGRVLGTGKVEVSGADGKAQTLETKNIVIATGSDVAKLKGIEIDEKRIVSSTGALSLDKVPEKMIVVGAGVIGLELGSVWRRLGAEVTVVEFLDRILPGMDGEVAKQFQRMLEKQGMTFKLGAKVTGVDTSGKKLKAQIEPAAGGAAESIEADVILVAIGRVTLTRSLLGLKRSWCRARRTRSRQDRPSLLEQREGRLRYRRRRRGPDAGAQGGRRRRCLRRDSAGQAGHVNYDVIPGVVYTTPEVAAVGKTEKSSRLPVSPAMSASSRSRPMAAPRSTRPPMVS